MKPKQFERLIKECAVEVLQEIIAGDDGSVSEAMNTYYTIVTLQYDDAKPVIGMLKSGDIKGAAEYLSQWDYAGESEHGMSMSTTPPWGKDEQTFKAGKYTIFYNPHIDMVGLARLGTKLKETSQPEPYDAQSDTMQPSPRERTAPSNPDTALLAWAQKRLAREGNPANVDALEKVIDMIRRESKELGESNVIIKHPEKVKIKVGAPGEELVAEAESDAEDPLYVEYDSERAGEEPFMLRGVKYQYVNAKYPDGKIDIGVYTPRGDVVYSYNAFRKMNNIQ